MMDSQRIVSRSTRQDARGSLPSGSTAQHRFAGGQITVERGSPRSTRGNAQGTSIEPAFASCGNRLDAPLPDGDVCTARRGSKMA
jgi:hypothetical protein